MEQATVQKENANEELLQYDNSVINSEYDVSEQEKNYTSKDIYIEKAYFSVFELKRKIGSTGKTKLDSSFQRNEVWKEKQQIELIESVLIGLPIPLFYFSKNEAGSLIVVDGRQRLTAFFKFMDNGFALKDLKHLPELEGKKFSDLDNLTQSRIEDYQIQANLILPPTPEQVQYDIFERVNRAGTSLNKQEIRNAINQGPVTQLLNELAESDLFSRITNKAFVEDKRMKSQYLILRFIYFYLWRVNGISFESFNEKKKNSFDDKLSLCMKKVNSFSEDGLKKLRSGLTKAFENFEIFCSPDDLRMNTNGKRTPINMNIFEVILYIMVSIPASSSIDRVKTAVCHLKANEEFLRNLDKHRDAETDIQERFRIADQMILEIVS